MCVWFFFFSFNSATFISTESTAATTTSCPCWLCLNRLLLAWLSLMVSVRQNTDCLILQPSFNPVYSWFKGVFTLFQAPLGTPCHRRSTQMCLSPRTGVTAGGGRWGALTTTAYWTLVGSLWLWRISEKDKSRPSSKLSICAIPWNLSHLSDPSVKEAIERDWKGEAKLEDGGVWMNLLLLHSKGPDLSDLLLLVHPGRRSSRSPMWGLALQHIVASHRAVKHS